MSITTVGSMEGSVAKSAAMSPGLTSGADLRHRRRKRPAVGRRCPTQAVPDEPAAEVFPELLGRGRCRNADERPVTPCRVPGPRGLYWSQMTPGCPAPKSLQGNGGQPDRTIDDPWQGWTELSPGVDASCPWIDQLDVERIALWHVPSGPLPLRDLAVRVDRELWLTARQRPVPAGTMNATSGW